MRRPVLLGAAWTASAAAAIGLGFLAVSLVDASASPGTSPVAATTSSSTAPERTGSAPDGSPPEPLASPASATGEYATSGGTVFADCSSGTPVLAGVPAPGWWVDPSDDVGKMEFENDDDDIDVHVACIDGAPRFALDDSAFRSPSASPSRSAATPSPTSGWDDSDGRSGDGHGSDD
ncbi:hypothetical protein E9549_00205 [Blastococcus sp. MG754426]|uniref:hypothetical protein n=1 Tax=unclassified Blastococcus TaxID=2619396 RepID=UPI001EF05440|nr:MULTISPECIES: hypothetical protein [unclassified Blastococcus]MCF6505840.1 hypothetical protein [Blastococcus sp. MG754426]MCF6511080.1 hypothetical protein [Blastococcus sp. MG754427]